MGLPISFPLMDTYVDLVYGFLFKSPALYAFEKMCIPVFLLSFGNAFLFGGLLITMPGEARFEAFERNAKSAGRKGYK